MVKVGRPPTTFSSKETATALATLAKNEDNLAQTSRELKETGLNITAYKLRQLRDKHPQVYEAARSRLVNDIYDKVVVMANLYADEIIHRIEDQETLGSMKIKDIAVTLGIAIDKLNVMTTVRSKSGEAQKSAEEFNLLTEEEMQQAIDAEVRELKAEEPPNNESVSGSPKDKLPIRSGGVPSPGALLHRRSDKGQP